MKWVKRKEMAQVKRKQTSIDVLCEKYSSPSFDVTDDEVICLEHKKAQEKRPVGTSRMYHKLENCQLDINELHNFNEILKVDQWYS